MTTWNSRITLRNDSDFTIDLDSGLTASLEKGEVAFAISPSGRVSGRIGVSELGTPWDECPEIFSGGTLLFPLSVEVPSGSGLDDGAILRWDPATSRFVADVEGIKIGTTETGALTYTASGDTWSIDTTTFIPHSLDGGAFTGSSTEQPVAPSFVSEPTFGEPEPV